MKQNLLVLSQGVTDHEILILLIYLFIYFFSLQIRRIVVFVQDVSISVIVFPSARSIVGKFLPAQFSKLIFSVSLTIYIR